MKRYTVIKYFIEMLHENDILIFSGSELCKEAYQYDKSNHFYIEDSNGMAISFGLGLAMCTDKRVFIFAGEGELLREFGLTVQIGASECTNVFLVLLDNGIYQSAGGYPNIFERITSKKGVMYNAGSKFLTFTRHFKDKLFKIMQDRMNKLVGPMIIHMEVDKGFKRNLNNVEISESDQKDRVMEVIQNVELETSMFVPPVLPSGEIRTLNIDDLSGGGITNGL